MRSLLFRTCALLLTCSVFVCIAATPNGRAASPPPVPSIEIVLTTGPVVRVPLGFDPSTLGQVLAVLEGRSC